MDARPLAAEYQRNYYLDRKRLGLWDKCGCKAEARRSRCDVCLKKARAQKKVLHPLICGECKQPIESKERVAARRFHKLCAEKRQARRFPSQHRSAASAYQRRHREMGLCLICPQKVFKTNLCRKHYRMAQERYHKAAG